MDDMNDALSRKIPLSHFFSELVIPTGSCNFLLEDRILMVYTVVRLATGPHEGDRWAERIHDNTGTGIEITEYRRERKRH